MKLAPGATGPARTSFPWPALLSSFAATPAFASSWLGLISLRDNGVSLSALLLAPNFHFSLPPSSLLPFLPT